MITNDRNNTCLSRNSVQDSDGYRSFAKKPLFRSHILGFGVMLRQILSNMPVLSLNQAHQCTTPFLVDHARHAPVQHWHHVLLSLYRNISLLVR